MAHAKWSLRILTLSMVFATAQVSFAEAPKEVLPEPLAAIYHPINIGFRDNKVLNAADEAKVFVAIDAALRDIRTSSSLSAVKLPFTDFSKLKRGVVLEEANLGNVKGRLIYTGKGTISTIEDSVIFVHSDLTAVSVKNSIIICGRALDVTNTDNSVIISGAITVGSTIANMGGGSTGFPTAGEGRPTYTPFGNVLIARSWIRASFASDGLMWVTNPAPAETRPKLEFPIFITTGTGVRFLNDDDDRRVDHELKSSHFTAPIWKAAK